MDLAEQVMEDIERFSAINSCSRLVMVWCASTEAFSEPGPVHQSLDAFERGLKESDPSIAPSQIYAYAALRSVFHLPMEHQTSPPRSRRYAGWRSETGCLLPARTSKRARR